ncbi:MAG TPA: PQQ-binding-like beta-propeller repeat protein [Ktedonobacteraceae bacterium]|nr:PQQ-binding-like beta-propeller repeat protein [Ktedonobacteraceae bacterium]
MINAHVRHTLLLGVCAFLFILSGCSVLPSQGGTQPVRTTPLTLPPSTPTPRATGTDSPVSVNDWTTYHQNNARTGLVANAPDPHRLNRAWSKQLDGAVYAEPLVVKGRLIVATEGDSLYSLNVDTGEVLWRTNVGTPVPQSTLPCGDIDPLGITGTPVYDPATNLVFAVAEVQGPGHILVGVDAGSGQVRVRRVIDIAAMEPAVHQQRAALALSQNRVYVAYGGLDGDCGNYHGTVVASRTDGTGPLLSYQLPTPREGGIWAASGPAVDEAGNIYVAVGNGSTTQGAWDKTDSVLRLSPTLQLEDGFAPTQWPQDNAADADLGSMGPILLPNGLIFIAGKSGFGYLLHADKLGGVGGQAVVTDVCHSYGGAAALGSQVFVPCTEGVLEVTVGPGASLHLGWQAPSQVTGSPIVGGHTVYTLDTGGTLYALDAANGNVRATLSVGATSRFASPTLSGNKVFVGTLNGVVAATIS